MNAKRIAATAILAVALHGCGQKGPEEPSEQSMQAGLAECANGGCKDFKKTSCATVAVDPASPSQNVFKCQYSYVPGADAAAGTKTDEKCFNPDGSVTAADLCK
ncbi:hypothetical protein [uncultured Hyphomicrobium sp.]|uniref:hypothetical protein n=1 Tax=uncultured Hyphomicrobium sp. TaxID=194373 RepID=UPI0025F5F168|nr:hypothetical protein [uncultured Hyphomicrobium sp.]